ncbi:hypothetical protein AYR56_02505 [Loigolactobacillus backii]|uniref:AraC-type arabinose-binding/dimerisation domain-containing protein n=1 Tax=Loigolactobacillus backii TaxID=375175 RepID=A0A192GYS6_9LACO|nr:hypothetical protein [Loigolactobacillus backii]ANK61679.1 hypothetical protein AYR53_02205 [Loigolactobacillus backii]ANK69123.1 hypothetical protein AYR56_02505 [Loigolactobacillus backii]
MKILLANDRLDTQAEPLLKEKKQVITHLHLAGQTVIPMQKSAMTVTVVPVHGRVVFATANDKTEIYPGKVVVMLPNEAHRLEALEDSDVIMIHYKLAE